VRFITLGIGQFISGLQELFRKGKNGGGRGVKRRKESTIGLAALAPWLYIGAPGLCGNISDT
jgi:hypothetical protein